MKRVASMIVLVCASGDSVKATKYREKSSQYDNTHVSQNHIHYIITDQASNNVHTQILTDPLPSGKPSIPNAERQAFQETS